MILSTIEIKPPIALAPLAGISDRPFRLICKEMGAGLVFSEMVSGDGLKHGNKPTLRFLEFSEEERPFGVQIFGSEAYTMAKGTEIICAQNHKADFLDINMGCPVPKVVKRGAGSALMKDLTRSEQIVKAIREVSDIPVMAKIRSGWDYDSIVAVEFAQMLEANGVVAITVHPRTRTMRFSGVSDWEIIRKVKEAVNVPVIGNGDINSGEDAKRMLDQTGCDMLMVGRASFGNPWIFREINHYLATGETLPPPTMEDRLDMCMRHFRLAAEIMSEKYAAFEMRKQICWYTRGMPDSTTFRNNIFKLKNIDAIKASINDYQKFLRNYDTENLEELVV